MLKRIAAEIEDSRRKANAVRLAPEQVRRSARINMWVTGIAALAMFGRGILSFWTPSFLDGRIEQNATTGAIMLVGGCWIGYFCWKFAALLQERRPQD